MFPLSNFEPRVTCVLFYTLTVVLPYRFRTEKPVLCYESNKCLLIKDRKRQTACSPSLPTPVEPEAYSLKGGGRVRGFIEQAGYSKGKIKPRISRSGATSR
jgi:hypothetical protein